ncbi:tigger transposable element-derived protein 4-like [Oscarella lobularis]|uniref:tigger transposable element-derived protein 4-like n=1 Tax=Oscarella lobularis TaxID=121494 RepID=UPI0033140396
MSKQKRTSLTLEDRVKVLREGEKKSQRQLAVMFGVSKSQIQQVLKRKVETMNEYERNSNPKRKKLRFGSEYEDIDELTFRWFERARGSGTPISGPMIQCQAMEFAKNLHKSEFKASNGWLARFKNRHNIGSKILSGERASVDELTVDDWIGRLPAIIENHDEKNIYNVDETAFFLRALPEKTLAVRGTDSAGGKKSKERFTVVLCVNLLDNASSHKSGDLQLSHVKIQFFPANTTSFLQPLDQGVIQNMKCHYRSKMLRTVLCKMESWLAASEMAKSFTVLDACLWIKLSVSAIKAATVRNCFRKAGFDKQREEISDHESSTENGDEQVLQQHIASLGLPQSADAANYIAFDESAPTTEVLEKGWENDLLDEFVSERNQESSDEDCEEHEDEEEVAETNITSISEARAATESLKLFAV